MKLNEKTLVSVVDAVRYWAEQSSSGVYGCVWCGQVIGKDVPEELRCECFPLHGQYVWGKIEGIPEGFPFLVDGNIIKTKRKKDED